MGSKRPVLPDLNFVPEGRRTRSADERASKRYAQPVARSRRAEDAHLDATDGSDYGSNISEIAQRDDDLRRRRVRDAPELQDVGDQGDCFFEALYRSARHAGMLDDLCKCLPIGESRHCCDRDISRGTEISEQDFIRCVRESLARAIAVFPNYQNHYHHIRSLDQVNRETVLDQQPQWLQQIWKTHGQTYEDFIRECAGARGIAQNGNWVGQLDVEVLQRILRDCGIHMPTPVSRRNVEQAEAYVQNDFDGYALQLVCIGDVHYNWVSGMRPLQMAP